MRYSRYKNAGGKRGRIMGHWASRATDAARLTLVALMLLGVPGRLFYQHYQGSYDVRR